MIFLYLLLWQFMVAIVVGDYHAFGNASSDHSANGSRYKRGSNHRPLRLKVRIMDQSKVVNLIPTNQLLGNEHLPIWLGPSVPGEEYLALHHIMQEDYGDFIMYHDYVTLSAVVYSRKRREFTGIVFMQHKIDGLSIDRIDEEHAVGPKFSWFSGKPKYPDHLFPSLDENLMAERQKCDRLRPKVYPELLIAISHDMFQDYTSKSSSPFIKLITHVITLYNIVDMLFKFVKPVDISLNIAGIVIEGGDNEWGFREPRKRVVDPTTVNDKISALFQSKHHIIRPHSYDYVIYHTRYDLVGPDGVKVAGEADTVFYDPVFIRGNNEHVFTLAVKDEESYECYTTIAHEMSHLFSVQHDVTTNPMSQHPCHRSVMAACGVPSLCLRWSPQSEKELKQFFTSRAHCILINKPQSLVAGRPRIILTAREQCRCYGFDDVYQGGDFDCERSIQCINKNGEISESLPRPRDGTPYGDVVCWRKKRVNIGSK